MDGQQPETPLTDQVVDGSGWFSYDLDRQNSSWWKSGTDEQDGVFLGVRVNDRGPVTYARICVLPKLFLWSLVPFSGACLTRSFVLNHFRKQTHTQTWPAFALC